MTTDFRALCVELTDCLEKADWPHRYKVVFQQWMDVARAALAEPEPEGPTVMEIIELAGEIEAAELGQVDLVRAAPARCPHQPAPAPVPVSERLPGPKDCDAEGRCWFSIDGAQWALEDRIYGCDRYRSHWLPAHALPLPAGEVER